MTVNILGAEYKISYLTPEEDEKLNRMDGYCDYSVHKIVARKYEKDPDSIEDIKAYTNKVLRHEIVHAFLCESGLSANSHSTDSWACDEEIVDWVAWQGPKIYKAWQEAEAI